MPFIETLTSVAVDTAKEKAIKEKLGEAISLLPGKSERWLMLRTEGSCRMAFAGDDKTPCAMVKVDLFGAADDRSADALTAKITEILSLELGIPPTRIYVRYAATDTWGFAGENF